MLSVAIVANGHCDFNAYLVLSAFHVFWIFKVYYVNIYGIFLYVYTDRLGSYCVHAVSNNKYMSIKAKILMRDLENLKW